MDQLIEYMVTLFQTRVVMAPLPDRQIGWNNLTTPAVLFILFNRPSTACRVFERIKQARPPCLYIPADGKPGSLSGDCTLQLGFN